jgi:AbiTii
MTLLQQILTESVDSSSDLASILRKCRVLAQRLGHDGFKDWVTHELEGYPDGSELPPYRISRNNLVLGHFVGGLGQQVSGAQIADSSIPEEFRDMLTEIRFFEGVAWIQEHLRTSGGGYLRTAWPPEACRLIGQGTIFRGMHLLEAHQVITTATLARALDSIRNKVVKFALELESRDPEAGEAMKNENQIPKEQVQQIFNTVIKGDVGNVAQGGSDFTQQATMQIRKGDIDSLVTAISHLGISPEDVHELRSAVADEPAAGNAGFGKKVTGWIGKIVSKAARGACTVSTSVASHVITDALKKYYGI